MTVTITDTEAATGSRSIRRSGARGQARRRRVDRSARRAAAPLSLLATGLVLLTTLATVYSFCRIFPNWSYFPKMAIIAIAVHGICLVGRFRAWSLALVGAITIALTVCLVGALFLPSTMSAGLIPSRSTWDTAWQALADSWSQFRVTVTPVPVDGGFGITLAGTTAFTAFLADGFAFRAYGRAEAVIPGGLIFVITSSLGYDRLRVASAGFWLVAALAAVVVLRAAHAEGSSPWLGGGGAGRRLGGLAAAALAGGAAAALAAVVVGPALPGAGAEARVSTRQQGGSGTEVLSPLVDIQARLVNRSNVELFTVESSEPRYWRLTALEAFDGRQWRQDRSYSDADDLGGPRSGSVVQRIRIESLGGIWLPSAYLPTGVATSVAFRYNAELGSLIRARGDLFTGLEYVVASEPPTITPEQLAGSSSDDPPADDYRALPDGFPDDLRQLAANITAGATNDYEQALLLQNWFRANFTYNQNVPRGHSDRAMESFIRAKEGYCEQFAGTFGALGRALGLSTRVAVGFTPGDVDDAGIFHVRGKHAHAWPEVWFDGIGWVPFEPTPGRGDGSTTGFTGVPAGQAGGVLTDEADAAPGGDGSGNQTPTENGVPGGSVPDFGGANPISPDGLDGSAGGSATTAAPPTLAPEAGSGGSGSALGAVILGLLALAVLWVVAMPSVLRALRSGRARTPADQVLAAWDDTNVALGAAGAARRPDETPVEYAERAWRMTGCDRTGIRRLAALVTSTAYSGSEPTDEMAEEAEAIRNQAIETLRRRDGLWARLMRRVDPRYAAIS